MSVRSRNTVPAMKPGAEAPGEEVFGQGERRGGQGPAMKPGAEAPGERRHDCPA